MTALDAVGLFLISRLAMFRMKVSKFGREKSTGHLNNCYFAGLLSFR